MDTEEWRWVINVIWIVSSEKLLLVCLSSAYQGNIWTHVHSSEEMEEGGKGLLFGGMRITIMLSSSALSISLAEPEATEFTC